MDIHKPLLQHLPFLQAGWNHGSIPVMALGWMGPCWREAPPGRTHPWLCPSLPGIFPGELAPCPDSVPIHKVQHQLSCQQQGKHPVGRALNGSRKGKDKELASFWSPRWATFFSLAGRGCNGSIGEVIYRNTVNYRNLLCKKVGEGLQQLWLAVGGWEGSRAGGQNLLFPGELLAAAAAAAQPSLAWNGAALACREMEEGTLWG